MKEREAESKALIAVPDEYESLLDQVCRIVDPEPPPRHPMISVTSAGDATICKPPASEQREVKVEFFRQSLDEVRRDT